MTADFLFSRIDLEAIHNQRLTEVSALRDILQYPPLRVAVRMRELPQLDLGKSDAIVLTPTQIKRMHDLCLAELSMLRELLGYPPIMTGKQLRAQKESVA